MIGLKFTKENIFFIPFHIHQLMGPSKIETVHYYTFLFGYLQFLLLPDFCMTDLSRHLFTNVSSWMIAPLNTAISYLALKFVHVFHERF